MAFPHELVRKWGTEIGWHCEKCSRSFYDGWLMEGHHKLPTSAGGKDTRENFQLLCVNCHYLAHVELRERGIDHPNSANLVLYRLRATHGGRTHKWLKENGFE